MIAAIILAAGKGTRLNSRTINKVALPFLGKPIINYAVDLLKGISSKTVIVVGAFSHSVEKAVGRQKNIIFVHQKKRLGTAHATKVGLAALKKYSPSHVLVGMGDHMMFYKQESIKKFIEIHRKKNATISFYTTSYHKPNELAWGRVERDKKGNVLDIVEQKDATEKQNKIKELNAAFYCFDFQFLKQYVDKPQKSEATGEYYLTDLIKIAVKEGKKVIGMPVRFREIGIGINRPDELEESQRIYKKFSH